ncbi:MAG: anti-sigma factor domain-containing protein [Chloroflexota bacterium]
MTALRFGGLTCDEVVNLAPGFVLGALDPAEADAVRAHLAACPEAHPEMAELGRVVPYLAVSLEPVEPPTSLKARILAAIAAEAIAGEPAAAVAAEPIAPGRPAEQATIRARPIVRAPWHRPRLDFAFVAAAVLAIALLGAWNLALQKRVSDLTAYRQGVVDVLDAAAAPGSQLAVLAADAGTGPRGLAALRADGTVVLAVRDLAPTTGSQVYETWLITGDAAPVPVGGFSVDTSGTATFVSRAGPAAIGAVVALTLEPGPGATTPTLPIVSKGIASPPPG